MRIAVLLKKRNHISEHCGLDMYLVGGRQRHGARAVVRIVPVVCVVVVPAGAYAPAVTARARRVRLLLDLELEERAVRVAVVIIKRAASFTAFDCSPLCSSRQNTSKASFWCPLAKGSAP